MHFSNHLNFFLFFVLNSLKPNDLFHWRLLLSYPNTLKKKTVQKGTKSIYREVLMFACVHEHE